MQFSDDAEPNLLQQHWSQENWLHAVQGYRFGIKFNYGIWNWEESDSISIIGPTNKYFKNKSNKRREKKMVERILYWWSERKSQLGVCLFVYLFISPSSLSSPLFSPLITSSSFFSSMFIFLQLSGLLTTGGQL